MNPLVKLAKFVSRRARSKRAALFRGLFTLNDDIRILDLGSEDGTNIHSVLQGTGINPENIYVADIDSDLVDKAHERYGFQPVVIPESGLLPFPDQFFDIVYCSSVIEHVTIPKDEVWKLYSGSEFKRRSLQRQKEFSDEIRRVGKCYFVQTPYRYFPVESHTWLPFIAWLPRILLIPILRFANRVWIKRTDPDWYLLNRREMAELFDDAEILDEKVLGLTKSIMAIKG